MIFKNINRRCGHEEKIGIAGGYGDMTGISKERAKEMIDNHEETTAKNTREAESKLCVECFMQLSPEERGKEMESHE